MGCFFYIVKFVLPKCYIALNTTVNCKEMAAARQTNQKSHH